MTRKFDHSSVHNTRRANPGEPFVDLIELPPDEIGWSDDSFRLAIAYVERRVSLGEAHEMQRWLIDNVAHDLSWPLARQIASSGLSKRSILLRFQYFAPSTLQQALDEIKRRPILPSRRSAVAFWIRLVALAVCVTALFAIALLMTLWNIKP